MISSAVIYMGDWVIFNLMFTNSNFAVFHPLVFILKLFCVSTISGNYRVCEMSCCFHSELIFQVLNTLPENVPFELEVKYLETEKVCWKIVFNCIKRLMHASCVTAFDMIQSCSLRWQNLNSFPQIMLRIILKCRISSAELILYFTFFKIKFITTLLFFFLFFLYLFFIMHPCNIIINYYYCYIIIATVTPSGLARRSFKMLIVCFYDVTI